MARQLQPSVVYIGDAERTFVKKVPKTDKVMRVFTCLGIIVKGRWIYTVLVRLSFATLPTHPPTSLLSKSFMLSFLFADRPQATKERFTEDFENS